MRGRIGRTIPRRSAHEPPAEGSPLQPNPTQVISIVADPLVEEQTRQEALELVGRLTRRAPRPVLHARVAIRILPDPALERPAIAKASLDVSGRVVRAHVAAKTIGEAFGTLEERLRQNLEHVEETRRARRHRTGEARPGEWHHGDVLGRRPEYFDRPVDERELVRRKTYALAALTPEAAVAEMDALDHEFHLFTNADTGEESVVWRLPAGGVGLQCAQPLEASSGGSPVAPDLAPAPELLLRDAIERLNVTGEPFLFFIDARTSRGNVLYRRYDGHYGLIEPAEQPSASRAGAPAQSGEERRP